MKLEGKVVVVTGGARGIGRGIALHLASLGCDVVISDVNLESWKEFGGEKLKADSVMDEIKNLGRKTIGIKTDVTKQDEVKNLIDTTVKEFGKIDILINNAGGLAGKVESSWASSVPEDELRATIDRNLIGTIFCCQHAAKYMKERRNGKIITTSSQAGLRAQEGGIYASYGAAKAGVIMYTKYLAQELAPFNINVNCIAPAYVETKRLAAIYYDVGNNREEVSRKIPLGRLAYPEDIAKVIGFLTSAEADYITGQCISICGGSINF